MIGRSSIMPVLILPVNANDDNINLNVIYTNDDNVILIMSVK